jgi:hypothetical protein
MLVCKNKTQSVSPVVVGFLLGFVPDLVYANWRCDDKYRLFKQHMQEQLRRQGLEQQQDPQYSQRN